MNKKLLLGIICALFAPLMRAMDNNVPDAAALRVDPILQQLSDDPSAQLLFAAKHNNYELAQQALRNGANPNARVYRLGRDFRRCDEFFQIPLLAAIASAQETIVQLMLDNGGNVHTRDIRSAAPLHHAVAAAFEHPEAALRITQTLITRGADVNAIDQDRSTPLHSAASLGQEELVRLLLAHGARANAKTKLDHTPLELCVSHSCNVPVAQQLLDAGADVNQMTTCGSPLHMAAYTNSPHGAKMALLLLSRGADITARHVHRTPRDVAGIAVAHLLDVWEETLPEVRFGLTTQQGGLQFACKLFIHEHAQNQRLNAAAQSKELPDTLIGGNIAKAQHDLLLKVKQRVEKRLKEEQPNEPAACAATAQPTHGQAGPAGNDL